ncbi:MAG: peptidase MA family metallohydrolase [Candidatus Omnitrophota bacterium]
MHNKIIKYCFCLLLLLAFYNFAIAADNNWHTAKSTHFIVYYKNAPEDFITQLTNKSEDYYDKIASDLGFTRFNFWLWDNRAKIYIHDNAADYQASTGQPGWSGGSTLASAKVIYTFPYAQGFFEKTLPHEMGHIIFREFVGFDNQAIPLWLEEGVASYQEKTTYSMATAYIKKAIKEGSFMPLDKLSDFGPYLGVPDELVRLFYIESFSIVDFLIREFGRDKFVSFCQDLRDKKNLTRAIASNYPFSDLRELDDAWQKYLKK